MQVKRLIICALGASQPSTMGGNTKITIEMARCLATKLPVHVFLPAYKLATFTNNLPPDHHVALHPLTNFPGNDKWHPLGCSRWYAPLVRELFQSLRVGADDAVFSCSDFHLDVLPIYPLQREFGFKWIPSVFLFVPFITENLRHHYRFPAIKYLIYWCYQKLMFALMKRRANAFVVTNHSDFTRFPKRFQDRLFAYYGGVNVEQIPPRDASLIEATRVVFCSRLHPQKGIDGFLDIWKLVVEHMATKPPRLSIIGNGDIPYERYLQAKAERLGIASTIEWLGYVNNAAKYAIYARAKFLVHPTIFDNNGMVAAEALCSGLPVVMQDLPALRRLYTTGCLKVAYGDATAYSAAIVKLLTDDAVFNAVAPTAAQIDALRTRWRWEARANEFWQWLRALT